jgi:excisionase family DNA binding protein
MQFIEGATRSRAPQRDPTSAPLTHTLNDAAHVTGLSRSTLYRHAAAGRLRLVKVGGRTLVDAASLRALLGAAG